MGQHKNSVLVIIPAYNRAEILPEAIKSVMAQDYPHVKTIIIDDGSTDHTSEVCDGYTKDYPGRVVYRYKENGGCASARNSGLDLIDEDTGYVCFLDSDDRLLPGKLSREVALMTENPDADFTYSSSIIFEEEIQEESVWKVAAIGRPERFAIEHFLTNEAKSSAILYRVAVVKNRRFRESLRYNEDSEYLQRIAIESKGIYSSEPGCWVRSHPGSKSRNLIEIYKAVLKSSMEILESYPEFYRSYRALADQRIRQVRKSLFIELVLNDQWDEARGHVKSIADKFILICRLNAYYKLKRFMGSVLRKYK